jgi:hypothetical protein
MSYYYKNPTKRVGLVQYINIKIHILYVKMQVDNKEFALEPIYKYTYSLNTVPLVMMPRSPA